MTEAREAGVFDNLPGAGKPLPGLADGYDALWWVKQRVKREQISHPPRAARRHQIVAEWRSRRAPS